VESGRKVYRHRGNRSCVLDWMVKKFEAKDARIPFHLTVLITTTRG